MAMPSIAPYPIPAEQTLPANIAPWTPDPRRAVLLVHDMQRYFVEPFTAAEQPARSLLANTRQLVQRCRALGVPVAYTAQPGDMTERERGLLKDFWGPGMRTSPEHQRIVDEVAPDQESRIFTKWRYSAFHNNELKQHLRAGGHDQLIVCGVYAHVGCLMTAVEAFTNDIETFFVADAVADFSEAHHRSALTYAASRCAVVLSTDSVLGQLERASDAARR
ncbi:Phenazine biosynthesis protein PhzD [Streptomyces albidoflavus]|uniref:isochorismatase family protein n=1 Tax=Streptomyces TaxID=1883 RepID=UPI0001AEEDEF|nr:isochorismatase family protein [Streptomyces albidoflavus]AGI86999.1 Phenazine biosynthesis protein PhzD [Streptomyces albidoflavus]QLP90770.1 Phenazine biosynthesis protein PhzD [Streptomyces albidoflavus]BDH49606.1 phenazine biosynthesis protein PhzD [Streptomyces albus]